MTKYATEWRGGFTGLDTVLDNLFFIWKKKKTFILQISHMASKGSFCIILQCDYRNQWSGRSDSKGPIRKFLSRRNKNKAGTCNPATRAVFLFSTLALFLPACLTLQLSSLRDPAAVAPSGPSGLAQDIIVCGRLRPVTWWSSDRAQVSLCALSELYTRDAEAASPRASTREQKQRLFLFFLRWCVSNDIHPVNAFYCCILTMNFSP